MRAFATLIALSLLAKPAFGQTPSTPATPEEDLIRWIEKACPDFPDIGTFISLNQVAGKAVANWIRNGRYRDALDLAIRFTDCLKSSRLGESLGSVPLLEQVICFVPLVIFEVEGKVDAELAAAALARCPKPPLKPEGDIRDWGETIRRYAHLIAVVKPPSETLKFSKTYATALVKSGFQRPGKVESKSKPKDEESAESGPDPVFTLLVLGIAAAVAQNDMEGLLSFLEDVFEGEDYCASPFFAALGFVQGLALPRRAALPLVQSYVLGRAPVDSRLRMVKALLEKFSVSSGDSKNGCFLTQVVSALVMSTLNDEDFDKAVSEGFGEDLAACLAQTWLAQPLPGSLQNQAAVLRMVREKAKGPQRGRWLCSLGEVEAKLGRGAEAWSAFEEAFEASEESRRCGARGLLLIVAQSGDGSRQEGVRLAKTYLQTGPDSSDIYMLIREADKESAKVFLVSAFREAGLDEEKRLLPTVMEAFIKIVDVEPGSRGASVAIQAVKSAGGPSDVREKVLFGLVAARHFVVAKKESEALSALREALKYARPDLEGAREGLSAFLQWLAANDHVRVLDVAVALAKAAALLDASVLASVGAARGEKGDRARGKRLLRLAVMLKPTRAEDWLSIADAYARMDEPGLATLALEKAGPESEWRKEHLMVKGRIEMAQRRYREAVAAFSKAADLARGSCEPVFFRGLACLLLGDAEEAARDFERCLAMGVDSPAVLGGLGYAYFDRSAFDKAEATFRQALAKDEKTADNHIGLAMTLFRQGRVEEAYQAYRRATELESAMKKGYEEAEKRGYIYSDIEKKAWTEMLKAFKKMGKE